MSYRAEDLAIYDFEDNLNDTLGLAAAGSSVGSISYSTQSPFSGSKSVKPATPGNGAYINFPLTLINTAAGSVEFAFRTGATVTANQTLWWGGGTGSASSLTIQFNMISGAMWGIVNGAGLAVAGPISINTDYYAKVTWNDKQVIFMLGNRSGSTVTNQKIVAFNLAAPGWGTLTANRIFNGFNGLDVAHITAFDWLRFTNIFDLNMPTPEPLDAPGLSAATLSSSSVRLTWTDDADGVRYLLYKNTVDDSATATACGWAAQGEEQFDVVGLTASTPYYFFLKVESAYNLLSEFSASATATTDAAAGPSAPTSFVATALSKNQIRLTWIDGASTDAFVVYRGTTDTYASASIVGSVIAGVQEYIDEGLASSTTYYYWLVPVNETAVGAESGPVNATTLSYEALDITASRVDLAYDLVQHLVAEVLRTGSVANFENGSSAAHETDKIALWPGYLEDSPDEAGMVQCDEGPPVSGEPVKTATCRIILRMPDDDDEAGASFRSGREKAESAAQAVYKYFRPDPGHDRTMTTLPSGRVVLVFKDARKIPGGMDGQQRSLHIVEVTAQYRDDDVP